MDHLLAIRRRLRAGGTPEEISAAVKLLGGEKGLAIVFTDDYFFNSAGKHGSACVKDTVTPANDFDGSPDDLLTYEGASPKMVRGPDGLLRYGAHNLLRYSEDVSNEDGWSLRRVSTPDAETLKETPENASHFIGQNLDTRSTSFSFEVKADGRDRVAAYFKSINGHACLNLSSGQIESLGSNWGQTIDASITALTDGWYRVTVPVIQGARGVEFYALQDVGDNENYPGDATKGFKLRKVHQYLVNSDPTYVKTTDSSRFTLSYEWDANGAPLGLLVEEQRTNLITHSNGENLNNTDGSGWGGENFVMTTNSPDVIAPDGTNTACKVVMTPGDGGVWTTVAGGGAGHVGSIYFRGTPGQMMEFGFGAEADGKKVTLTGEWQRESIVSVGGSDLAFGWGTAGTVYFWGAQLEEGAFATSPILTNGAQVTRAADRITIAKTALHYALPMTFFVQAQCLASDGDLPVIGLKSGSIIYTGYPDSHVQSNVGGWFGAEVHVGTNEFKASLSVAADGYRGLNANGFMPEVRPADVGVWPGMNDVDNIGFGSRTGATHNIYLKKIAIFNRAMTGVEQQEITEA